MIRKSAAALAACVAAFAFTLPALAQSNNDDYTPLNSRIKRSRAFPTDIVNHWVTQTDKVSRAHSKMMLSQFTGCIYKRSKSGSIDLLNKTDYGFGDFAQIGIDNEKALRIYGFKDCLGHVAQSNDSSVLLRWSANGLREWLVQEAYFDRYPAGPSWVQPGLTIAERTYAISPTQPGVKSAMDLADCMVATDPYTSDFFYRTVPNSAEEKSALDTLSPAFGPCVPRGVQLQLSIPMVRIWLGEALWHAANHSSAAPSPSASAQ